MIIAQISDTHIELDSPEGAQRMRDLERCVADINSLDPQPDVVIHTGDLVHNGNPDAYAAAKRILSEFRPPLHVTAGNRDERRALRTVFPAEDELQPGSLFRQFRVNGYPVRLIVLDTLSRADNRGDFCETRADCLAEALEADATRPTAVFMHHPAFEVVASKYPFQFGSRDAIGRLTRVLNGHGRVVRAFCGHTHRDATGMIGDVPVSSTPSVAVDLRLGDFPEACRAAPVYQLHRFDPATGFRTELCAAL